MALKQVVERWVELFNAGDADGLALSHEAAINHQVADAPVEGRQAIRERFRREFAAAEMTCIPETIHEAGEVAILEWRDPLGLRGCGFFTVREGCIVFRRGYWDRLSFLRLHGHPVPPDWPGGSSSATTSASRTGTRPWTATPVLRVPRDADPPCGGSRVRCRDGGRHRPCCITETRTRATMTPCSPCSTPQA